MKNNDQAFPVEYNGHKGMTLRDYFAAKAMQADVSSSNWSGDIDFTVEMSFKIADAMLAEREAA
jgi:hypothetical protein